MIDGERLLQPGINFTNRAELKFAHAVNLANQLTGRIDEWSASERLRARIHQVDPHTIEFRLILDAPPPVDEWSLILGDLLHNFRSIYDTIAWAYATIDGATPARPSKVTFPVAKDESSWKSAAGNLESVPPELLERMHQMQPWIQSDDHQDNLLWLLHRLDIVDKHMGLISGDVHISKVSTAALDLGLSPAETAPSALIGIEMKKDPVRAVVGAVVETIRCETHEFNVDPDYVASVHAQFRLNGEDDRGVFLSDFVKGLIDQARTSLDYLYGGRIYAQTQAVARSVEGPAVTYGFINEDGETKISIWRMAEPA